MEYEMVRRKERANGHGKKNEKAQNWNKQNKLGWEKKEKGRERESWATTQPNANNNKQREKIELW